MLSFPVDLLHEIVHPVVVIFPKDIFQSLAIADELGFGEYQFIVGGDLKVFLNRIFADPPFQLFIDTGIVQVSFPIPDALAESYAYPVALTVTFQVPPPCE